MAKFTLKTNPNTAHQFSTPQMLREILIVSSIFFAINGALLVIYYILPNMYTVNAIVVKTDRFADLHHVFTFTQFFCSIIAIFANIVSAWLCWRSRLLFKVVAMLLIADSLTRAVYSALLVLAFYCVFPSFIPSLRCDGFIYKIYEWLQIFLNPFLYISSMLQITLSLNRFLALSFGGMYYHRMRRYPWLQVAIPYVFGFVSRTWIADIFNVRITIVSATISLDFILIYKMIKSKKTVNLASERFLFAQIVANNFPFTYCYLLAPFLFITIMPWAPMVSDFFYYFGNLLLYSGSQLCQAVVTIYLLRKDERKNIIRSFSHQSGGRIHSIMGRISSAAR